MSFEAIAKQTTRVTSIAVCQRPSSRWCSINSHFKPQVPFWAKNGLSGLELYYFGLWYPFRPYIFSSRLPFWVMNIILGNKYPFGPRKHFQEKVVFSRQICPFGPRRPWGTRTPFWDKHALFGPRRPYWVENALSYHEFSIGSRMSFLIVNALLGRECPLLSLKQQSTIYVVANKNQSQQAYWALYPYFSRVRCVW